MNVFAVGENGTIVHYNGAVWQPVTSPTTLTLQRVWGFSAEDVYAVGGASGTGGTGSGVIIHYDGREWSIAAGGAIPRLKAIWGAGEDSIFVVGDAGTIMQYNKSEDTWDIVESGTGETLRSVWGFSDTNMLAAGDYGTILHYDGASWEPVNSGVTSRIFGVWGPSPDSIFAAGDAGMVLRSDGQTGTTTTTTAIPCPAELIYGEVSDEVAMLRHIRDAVLRESPQGQAVIRLYYLWSPVVVQILANDPRLRQEVRRVVDALLAALR
jgi:photosystem II stability/assembly factor-like uncharacterized protein